MIALVILPLILAFSPAAVWALRGGGFWRLWTICALALLSIALLALGLSVIYSVPSTARLTVYLLAFCGPSVVSATMFLSLARVFMKAQSGQLPIALAGSMVGLAFGFILVVYGLRVW
jgi:hypothetical protein